MSNQTSEFFKEKKQWSTYKDEILGTYLKPYFQKMSSSPTKTIYIDGFAGKGLFDDGAKGSPLIVKDIILEVEQNSKNKQKMIYPAFVENKYAQDLELNLGNKAFKVFNADYKTQVNAIISKNINKFNFFLYVDPFGIKDIDFDIFKLLASNNKSSELLLNLNSFGFVREGCRIMKISTDEDIEANAGEFEESSGNDIVNMNKIANGTEWQGIIKEIGKSINGKEAESLFVNLYVRKLGEYFKYVFAVPIRTRDNLVPKYQMIFATNHEQGAFIMCDAMLKCDVDMSSNSHNGQLSFFDYDNTKCNINDQILSLLDENNWIDCKHLCFNLFNAYKIYFTKDIRTAIKQLEKDGKILVDRHNKKTKTGQQSNALDFEKSTIHVKKV